MDDWGERRSERGESHAAMLGGLGAVVLLVALAAWLVGSSGDDGAGSAVGHAAGGEGPTQELVAFEAEPHPAGDVGLASVLPGASVALSRTLPPQAWEDAPEGSTRGQVLTLDGELLAGATVRVFPTYEGCAEATTDELGRWWMGPATDLRGYGLIASHPDYAPDIQTRPIDPWQPVASTPTVMYEHRLRPLVAVEGLLRWDDGEPIANTLLRVREASPIVQTALVREPLGVGATDVEGRFALRLGARQIVRIEPEGPLAKTTPLDVLVHEVGEGPEETWELVVPRPGRLRVAVLTDPELHADVLPDDLKRARVVVTATLDGQTRPTVEPLVDGHATIEQLDTRVRHMVQAGVPGYEPAVLDWSLQLEGELTERVYDLPELVPSDPTSPPPRPEDGFKLTWSIVGEDGNPLGREQTYALVPYHGGPFGRVEAESLSTGETGAALLGELGSDSASGRLTVPVPAPARLTVTVGDTVTEFDGVEDGDSVQLFVPSGPDHHDVLLCPVDEHGRPLGVWGVILRDERGGPARIVPVLNSLELPVRLAAGRWHGTPKLLGGRAPVTTTFDVPAPGGGDRILLAVPQAGAVRVQLTPWLADGSYDVSAVTAEDGAVEGAGYGVPFFVAVDGDGVALLRTVAPGRQVLTSRRRGPDGVVEVAGRIEVDVVSGELIDVDLPVRRGGGGRAVDLSATLYHGRDVRERVRLVELTGPGGDSRWAVLGLYPSRHRLAYGEWTARWTGHSHAEQASLPGRRETAFTVVPGDGLQKVDLDD